MAGGDDAGDPPPFFPWDHLPVSIQETILSLLPISTLIACKSVSRSLRSTVQSPAFTSFYHRRHRCDLLFLLFSDSHRPSVVAAYQPSRDRWLSLTLPRSLAAPQASAGSLVIEQSPDGRFLLSNPLAAAAPIALPPMLPVKRPYILAFIADERHDSASDYNYKIIAVSTGESVQSQIYDFRSGNWELRGEIPRQFTVLGNAAYLDGLVYCLSRGPDHLLTFDPVSGEWVVLDLAMPTPWLVCAHLLVFDGRLFLVAGIEEVGAITSVGIWKLDLVEKAWRVHCFMPDRFFAEFARGSSCSYFETVDRAGMICFCNRIVRVFLMCDLATGMWRWARQCDVGWDGRLWFGQVIEPCIDLVK